MAACRRTWVGVALFSACVNLLILTIIPMYMVQVYDRVLITSSIDALLTLVRARAGQPHPGRRHRRGAARRGGVSAQWLHPSTPVPGWIGLVGAVALFGCAALNDLAPRKRLTEANSASVRARAERRRRRHPQRGRHHRHELFRGTVRVSASAKN